LEAEKDPEMGVEVEVGEEVQGGQPRFKN